MFEKFVELGSSAVQLLNLVLHLVVVDDLPECLFVLVMIKNSQSDACVTEVPGSADSVHIIQRISLNYIFVDTNGNFKIYDNFYIAQL